MATAPSHFLQEPSLKWKNHLHHSPQSPGHTSFANLKIRKSFKKLSVKCFFTNYNSSRSNDDSAADQDINKIGFVNVDTKKTPIEIAAKSIINAFKALQKPAAAAVLVGLLLMYNPNSALAASGGRMGGNSFSSRSSISSSSRSYTAPRMGAGSGFSYSVPYYAPSPFGGVYVGPLVGVGSSVFLIMIAFAAFVLVSGFLSEGSESSVLTATEKTSVLKLQVGLLGLGRSLQKDLNRIAETADTSTSEGLHYVLTETVLALLRHPDYCISAYSSVHSMRHYLGRNFNLENAGLPISEVLMERSFKKKEVDVKRSMDEGEKRFNQLSIEERGKFDEETLVNVNNIKKQSSTILKASGFSNEYIVITILVAAGGAYKLPSINNSKDLKEALQKLASIPSSRTLAVEVLWTPQNEDDTLSERELLEDYPLLRPL